MDMNFSKNNLIIDTKDSNNNNTDKELNSDREKIKNNIQ